MSRIVVKNLPSEITEDDLSRIFRQKGTLTAVDVKRTPSGRSRHFAFIGYHDEHDADEAIRSLNHTFIKTNKIQVEKCHAISKGQTSKKPKPTPKGKVLTKGLKRKFPPEERPALKKKLKKGNLGRPVVEKILVEKYKSDPEFAEFLDLKSPDQAAKVRARLQMSFTDLTKTDPAVESDDFPFKKQKMKRHEILNLLHHVKLKNLPKRTNKTHIKEFFHPLDCVSIRIPKAVRGIAYVGFMKESQRQKALQKDKSFIRGEPVRVIEYNEEYVRKRDRRPAAYSRLFFYDMPSTSSVDELTKLFSSYGKLRSLVIPKLPNNNLKGFGLATYVEPADANKAFEHLSKTAMKDKIVISPELSGKVRTRDLEECERTEDIFDVLKTAPRRGIQERTSSQSRTERPSGSHDGFQDSRRARSDYDKVDRRSFERYREPISRSHPDELKKEYQPFYEDDTYNKGSQNRMEMFSPADVGRRSERLLQEYDQYKEQRSEVERYKGNLEDDRHYRETRYKLEQVERQLESHRDDKGRYSQPERSERTVDNYRSSRDERNADGYRQSREQRSADNYRPSRDEKNADAYRQSRDQRSADNYRSSRDERTDGYRPSRDDRSVNVYRPTMDNRSADGYRPSRDDRSANGYQQSREERTGADYRQSRYEGSADGYRPPRDERSADVYRQSRDERSADGYRQVRNERSVDNNRRIRDDPPKREEPRDRSRHQDERFKRDEPERKAGENYRDRRSDNNEGTQIVYRIYLMNLPATTLAQDIEKIFRPYGPSDIHLPLDSNNRHNGHCIITFREKNLSKLAYRELQSTALKYEMIPYTGPANRCPPEVTRRKK